MADARLSANVSTLGSDIDSSEIADDSIVDADINSAAAISQSKIANLTTDLAAKAPTPVSCTGSNKLQWNGTAFTCVADVDTTIANTNAGKICSAGEYLDGDGTCKTASTSAGDFLADGSVPMSGNLDFGNNKARFKSDNTNYVELIAPNSLAATYALTFPANAGSANQVLQTNGSGVLSWVTATTGTGDITDVVAGTGLTGGTSTGSATLNVNVGTGNNQIVQLNGSAQLPAVDGSQLTNVSGNATAITDGVIVDADINASAAIAQSKIAGLAASLTAKENSITAGTTAQYFRGDKSWQALNPTAVGLANVTNDAQLPLANRDNGALSTSTTNVPTSNAVKNYVDAQVSGVTSSQWTTNGSDIHFSTGNVGIGTTTPSSILDIRSNAPFVRLYDTDNTIAQNNFAGGFQIQDSAGDIAASIGYLSSSNNDFDIINKSTTGAIDLWTNNSPRLRVDENGLVGIGTTSPSSKLHVNLTSGDKAIKLNQVSSSDFIRMERTGTGAGQGGLGVNDLGIHLYGSSSYASNHFSVGPSGNVGVGVATAGARLNTIPIGSITSAGNLNQSGLLVGSTTQGIGIDVNEITQVGDDLYLGSQTGDLMLRTDANSNGNLDIGLILKKEGLVGIGTANPDSLLTLAASGRDISGASTVGQGALVIEDSSGDLTGWKLRLDSNELQVSNDGVGATYTMNPFGGNIGLGNNTSRISVGAGNIYLNEGNGDTSVGPDFKFSSSGLIVAESTMFLNIDSDNDGTTSEFIFSANSNTSSARTELMRISENGRVGIGTATPSVQLAVHNGGAIPTFSPGTDTMAVVSSGNTVLQVTSSNTHGSGIYFSDEDNRDPGGVWYNHANDSMQFRVNDGSKVYIDSAGNTGIGIAVPTHKLHVNGIARSTQSTWATSSDKRVKENIVNVNDGLEKIMSLRPVRYNYVEKFVKSQPSLKGVKTGFIAQEVAKVDPSMVNYVEEKFENETIEDFNILSTDNMIPLLVGATQEQQVLLRNNQERFPL